MSRTLNHAASLTQKHRNTALEERKSEKWSRWHSASWQTKTRPRKTIQGELNMRDPNIHEG